MTRVLYVDDEEDIREIAKMALELDEAFEVRLCSSGIEALEVAPSWCPDLVLLDVMMPQMDGPATYAKLRDIPELAKTPIVFITARTQASERDSLLSLGASGLIAKPFDPMRLAAHARELL
jgi:two-component system OmpR family response regulator